MKTIGTGLTVRGLNGLFYPQFRDAPALWRLLCTVVPSDGAQEDYKFLGTNPVPNEWLGDRKVKPHESYGFSIVNKDWESTLAIDRNEVADDQTGQIQRRVADFARRFAQHPDKILVELLEAGFAATMGLAYDGQFFFDDDHSEGDSGTLDNDLTTNITTASDPTQAEFKAAFWANIEALMGFKDDNGEPANYFQSMSDLSQIAVLVPINMMEVANEVLGPNGVDLIIDAGGNAAKSNNLKGKGSVWTNPRLTNNDRFYTFYTGDAQRAMIFQDRQKVETELDDSKERKHVLYMADARYNVGFGDYKKAVAHIFT